MAREKMIMMAQRYPLQRDIPTFLYFLCFPYTFFFATPHSMSMSTAVFSAAVSHSYFSIIYPSLSSYFSFISPELINYFVISAEVSTHIIFTLKITSGSTTNLLHACAIKLCFVHVQHKNYFPFAF